MFTQSQYICAKCGKVHLSFRLYCKECGFIMPSALSRQDDVTILLSDITTHPVSAGWGRSYFHAYARLTLRRNDTGEALDVPLEHTQVLIGRASVNFIPQVAFSAPLAEEMGISRLHARLERRETTLLVTDLQSTNGTFLDGARLVSKVAYKLHNKALLQLGKLVLHVEFR